MAIRSTSSVPRVDYSCRRARVGVVSDAEIAALSCRKCLRRRDQTTAARSAARRRSRSRAAAAARPLIKALRLIRMSGVAPRLCRGKPAFGEVGEVLGLFGKLGKFLVARLREDLPQRGFTSRSSYSSAGG